MGRRLDFGRWQVQLCAGLRRPRCPTHGVPVEAVPFARVGTGFTHDLQDLVAFGATKTDKTTLPPVSPGSRGTPWAGSARRWSPTGSTPAGSTGGCASGSTR